MKRSELESLDDELTFFLEDLFGGLGRFERLRSMVLYVSELLLDGERKSIVPMAWRLLGGQDDGVSAMRQRLQECVAISTWSESEVWSRLIRKVEAELPCLEAMVVDDTGFAKKGEHSVGVTRQYSGTLGRIDNCQGATSLHVAGMSGSVCIGMRLYMPLCWMDAPERRVKAGVPCDVVFQRKWEIALSQIDAALASGARPRPVLADAGYGDASEFRDGLHERKLPYVVGIAEQRLAWPPGSNPKIPPRSKSKLGGRPFTRYYDGDWRPISLGEIARALGRSSCQSITWARGSKGAKRSTFGFARIRMAEKHTKKRGPGTEEWLVWEWPPKEAKPTRFWISSMPENTPLRRLVYLIKLRWRVERDYQEMKTELGLDHFEGRTWRGFHHHATLCAVAHAFLALTRALFSPEDVPMDACADA